MVRNAGLLSLVVFMAATAVHPQEQRGGLWSGHVRARYQGTTGGTRHDLRVSIEVRLREYRSPMMHGTGQNFRRVGTLVRLLPEGSVMTNTHRCSGGGVTCRGEGTARVTIEINEQGQGHPSGIWYKEVDVDISPGYGYNFPAGDPMYSVWITSRSEQTYQLTFSSGGQSTTTDARYITPQVGWMWSTAGQPWTDPQVRRLQGGAMRGSYSAEATGAFQRMTASWSICREGSVCPPPPDEGGEAPEPEDDCRDSPLKGQMELNRTQRADKAAEMKKAWDRVVENQDILDSNIEAWRAFVDACAIVEIIQQTVDAVIDNLKPEEFSDAIDLFTNLLEGDLIGSAGFEDLENAQDLLETAFPNGTPSSWVEGMREKLQDCPNLNSELTEAAGKFVKAYGEMPGLMSETHRWINQIRQLDRQYWELWNRYYADCLATAECRGLPASSCEEPPPQPE